MTSRKPLFFLFVPAALAAAAMWGRAPSGSTATAVTDSRYVMGTVLEVSLEAGNEAKARDLLDRLFSEAERLDRMLTSYDPQSALSRLNGEAGNGPRRVPCELRRILSLSVDYWRLSGKAFDVTVGPLVDLWKGSASRGAVPSEVEIELALSRVGSGKVVLVPDGSVALARKGMAIDLGGIAKGYALDRLEEMLRAEGISSAFLSFGQSSISGVGRPRDKDGWRVLVRRPGGGFVGVATLRDRALSVSSGFGHWTEVNGQRYGHIIDPRSGRVVTRDLEACVVAPDGAMAEALTKALLLLGEEEGIMLLEGLSEVEGLLVDPDGKFKTTSGWQEAVSFTLL